MASCLSFLDWQRPSLPEKRRAYDVATVPLNRAREQREHATLGRVALRLTDNGVNDAALYVNDTDVEVDVTPAQY